MAPEPREASTRSSGLGLLSSLALALGVLALATPAGALEDTALRVLVSEDFEAPRALPAFPTYEKPPRELLARVEQGEPWHLIVEPGSAATAEVADGVAVLRIERAGAHWYAVQLAYLPIALRPGSTYRVTFRARADRAVRTTFDLAHVGEGWHSYSGKRELDLGASWQPFELSFTTGRREEDRGARFEFNFGDVAANVVYVDDVRIAEELPKSR